ncbi:MAG: acetyltransferase [Desulfuromonadaceae bacterium]|nr:acetyltransferase [Desulfuromonadaceae bacterium]MDD2854352.1 acetyltransferase [Desulfuromonadaceae bacterium]
MKEKIFIFGASGHAKVVIDIIERQGLYEVAFLVDDDPALKGIEFYGYKVIGGKEELLAVRDQISCGIVAIGSNRARIAVAEWLICNNFDLVSAIHPFAQLGRGVTVDTGSVIMAGAVINSDCSIGRNVIVNTCASIDHDCTVGDGAHIAPGTTLCGTVRIGNGTFVCAGATIIPNLNIGDDVIVGAGSTVIQSLADGVTAVGSPAKILK